MGVACIDGTVCSELGNYRWIYTLCLTPVSHLFVFCSIYLTKIGTILTFFLQEVGKL